MRNLISLITLGLLSSSIYASEISATYGDYKEEQGLSYNLDIDIYSNFSLIGGYTKINADTKPSYLGLGVVDNTSLHIFEDNHKFLNISYGLKYTYPFNELFSTSFSTQQLKTTFTDSKVYTENKGLLHSIALKYEQSPFSVSVSQNRVLNYSYLPDKYISYLNIKLDYFLSDNFSLRAEYSDDSILVTETFGLGVSYRF